MVDVLPCPPPVAVVRFPGVIKNAGKALDMLGGTVPSAVTGVSDLKCRLCPENRFLPPLWGGVSQNSGTIIIARNKISGTTRIVGHATTDFSFDVLADYHYSAPEKLQFGKQPWRPDEPVLMMAETTADSELKKLVAARDKTTEQYNKKKTMPWEGAEQQGQTTQVPTTGAKEDEVEHAGTNTNKRKAGPNMQEDLWKQARRLVSRRDKVLDTDLMYLPPPMFTKTTFPQDYNFEGNRWGREG